ncbi:MAG: DNA gyrase subunit A [Nanoarchaeales archaeon]|nr:DNA gyrase subunit A [Nanoarchaeales archaeon]
MENNASLRTKDIHIENELKDSYLQYAMSVIVGRALPEVRDGLKPVHRRIIYAMFREGLLPNKKYSKCAGVVGEVLKKYHPHGDSSVYDAMVRLAQEWNMRYTIVDGQGNFGSMEGDGAAAYRYTEAKMTKFTEKFLNDIDKETVKMVPNFDEQTVEPTVLPTKIPTLLVNGSSGIAVGMATNIPPHNLGEVVDAALDLIENPQQSVEELVRKGFVKGPDFPTGATMLQGPGLQDIYINGEGAVTMKAVCSIEEFKKNREAIIIEQVPYQTNITTLINQIVDLVKNGKIKDISDIRNETNKNGIRIVIEVKKDADPNIVLNQLYQYSTLKSNFNARLLAIVAGVPTILNLKSYLHNFIDFRVEVVVKRTEFDKKKSLERLHILEGLTIALDNIDDIIALIKASKTGADAKEELISRYKLSEIQAQGILDMKLQKLTGLETDKIRDEFEAIVKVIEGLNFIIDNVSEQMSIVKAEMIEVREKFNDPRRTIIVADEGNIAIEDLIKDEDFAVMVTQNDYIKKVPIEEYRSQKRGGKGVSANFKDEDVIKKLFVTNSRDSVLIFTSDGNINWMKAYEIPTMKATMKGRPIVNYIDLRGKKITNIVNVSDLTSGYLIFLTKKGIIKKTEMKNFAKPRNGGIKAINLDEGDTVLSVIYTHGDSDIVCESNVGMSIRFKQTDLSILGRTARGVKAMNLRAGEEVVGIELAQPGKTLLTVTKKGFGKRTLLSQYTTIKRAGRGVLDIKTGPRNGKVVTMNAVNEEDDLFIITKKKVVRTPVSDFRIISRNTMGVKVVNLDEDDEILSVEVISAEHEE